MNISTLRARLAAILARVRRGERVTVLHRRKPVARLVPLDDRGDGLVIEPAAESPAGISKIRGVRPKGAVDIDALLAEMRQDRV